MINFIESSREKIKEALENNRLSIFVGSGVSLNSGFPSWSDIIFKFASEMGLIESFKEDKSTENYLKISEQYYIERGKKEYIETVKALFPNYYELNEIHEYLAEIKPQNYITTNYDNLLEEMADCNFQNYNFIKSNEDLPYSTTNSSIIKLHGDFEKNNFVLKESDFLSFSNNFKLVENKVKELLSSNLILFIGYSVSDPNFKLIMQMVKDTLHEDFQNTYLLDINKKYSKREFDYYKNRGINVLYYDELEEVMSKELKNKKFNTIQHESGRKLYFFLRYLFDENKKNKTEKLKEDILLIDKIDYIGVETLRKILKKYNIQIRNNNKIYVYNEENKEEINNLECLKSKKEFLEKNNIKDGIGLDRQNIELFKYSSKTYEVYKTDKNFMKRMFYFYYFDRDDNTETFIKELSKYSLKTFKEKDYIKHFIINLNIKKITGDDFGRNLDLILSEMPKSYKVIKEILNNFKDLKIFYKLNFEISKITKEIDEMKNNVENGGFSFNSYFQKINSQMEDLFYIIHRNFLLVDPFLLKSIVINFFEVMLNYSSIDPNINNINYFKKSMNNGGKERFKIFFSKFDFIIMYHYLDHKDIHKLREKYDWSNTEINKNSKVDITNFFIDEIKFLFQNEKKEKIKTILIILTLLDITSNEIVEVIKKLRLKGQSNEFYKFVNRFILHYIAKIEISKDFENIVDILLIELLDKHPLSNYRIAMLNNLFYIFRFEEEKIKKWIDIILIGNYSKEHKEDIISFCSEHKDLKIFIKENKMGDILYNGSLQLKHDLIINNVLEDNKKILLDILNSKNIEYLESLYVNNKILPEIIKKYNLKEKSILINLLENPELFSIEKVKEINNNYIFMGNSMVHKNIKKNEKFKKYAIDLIKGKLNSDINNNIKKSLTDILYDNYL